MVQCFLRFSSLKMIPKNSFELLYVSLLSCFSARFRITKFPEMNVFYTYFMKCIREYFLRKPGFSRDRDIADIDQNFDLDLL